MSVRESESIRTLRTLAPRIVGKHAPEDILDSDIASEKSQEETRQESSPIRSAGASNPIQVEDFIRALEPHDERNHGFLCRDRSALEAEGARENQSPCHWQRALLLQTNYERGTKDGDVLNL